MDYDFMPQASSKKQRLAKATVAGIITMLLCAVILAYFFSLIGYMLSFLFILGGFIIGQAVKQFGKSFQKEFLILAGFLAFIFCILTEVLTIGLSLDMGLFGSIREFPFLFNMFLKSFSTLSKNSIVSVLFMIISVMTAYGNASSIE